MTSPAYPASAGWGGNVRFLFSYLGAQRWRVPGLVALILLSILLQLINPQVIRYFLDTASSGGAPRLLLLAAAAFIAFAILHQGIDLSAAYLSQLVSWAATNQLRAGLARHCLKLDLSFHKQHTPGEMIERVDGDVSRLGNFFSQLSPRLLGNGLLVTGILALLLREDWRVGCGMLLYTAGTLSGLGLIQRPAADRWAAERQASAEKFSFLEERISGVEDLRACGAEAYAVNQLLRLLRNYLEKLRLAFVISNLTQNLTNLVHVIGYAIGLALGVYLYTRGRATLGTAYLIVTYVGMLAEPLQSIRAQIQDLQQASASLQRLRQLFALQPGLEPAVPSAEPARLPGGALPVAFENVSFAYQDTGADLLQENVLHEVSFRLPAGKVLGILGRTGSGKSTLTRLLFRLYDPGAGTIRLGGTDLRYLTPSELRQRVGMVTQDVQLFDATLRANLSFFNPAITSEQLEGALQMLRLWDWVQSLPQGLDTPLASGQSGSFVSAGLSAGEAQLLAFTRVFLKSPGLVILDEASSRLDPLTEALMEHAVDRLFAGRTGILIAHRLKTVQRADDILILENGRVVEYGDRRALAASPTSRFHALLQTGLEEVLA